MYNSRPIRRISGDGTVKEFPSIVDAAANTHVDRNAIMRALRGKSNYSAGYHWEYVDGIRHRDVRVTTPDGEVFFYSNQGEAAKAHGLNPNTVRVAMSFGCGTAKVKGHRIIKTDIIGEEYVV